jgi:hypothetical protein
LQLVVARQIIFSFQISRSSSSRRTSLVVAKPQESGLGSLRIRVSDFWPCFSCRPLRLSVERAARFSRCSPILNKRTQTYLVGLGRLELPTSPLSGVRSNHLSYRPVREARGTGGAGRDRTGDLLNANQALSQLSYSPISNGKDRSPFQAAALSFHVIEADWTRLSQDQLESGSEVNVQTLSGDPESIWSGTAATYCNDPVQTDRRFFGDSTHVLS